MRSFLENYGIPLGLMFAGSFVAGTVGAVCGGGLGGAVVMYRRHQQRKKGKLAEYPRADIAHIGIGFFIFVLLVTPYNFFVVHGAANQFDATIRWLDVTAPAVSAAETVVPAVRFLDEKGTPGPANRIRSVRHVYAMNWLLGIVFVVSIALNFRDGKVKLRKQLREQCSRNKTRFTALFLLVFAVCFCLFLGLLFFSFVGPQFASSYYFDGVLGLRRAVGIGPSVGGTIFIGAVLLLMLASLPKKRDEAD